MKKLDAGDDEVSLLPPVAANEVSLILPVTASITAPVVAPIVDSNAVTTLPVESAMEEEVVSESTSQSPVDSPQPIIEEKEKKRVRVLYDFTKWNEKGKKRNRMELRITTNQPCRNRL